MDAKVSGFLFGRRREIVDKRRLEKKRRLDEERR